MKLAACWQRTASPMLLIALITLASFADLSVSASLQSIEVDLIFPRNESYITTDVLPLSFLIQNYTALPEQNGSTLNWIIQPYQYGNGPTGVSSDAGSIHIPDNTANGSSVVLTSYLNTTSYLYGQFYPSRWSYMLQYTLSFQWDNKSTCVQYHYDEAANELMFSLTSPLNNTRRYHNDSALQPDVQSAPACPVFGAIVGVQSNLDESISSGNSTDTSDTCRYSYTAAATGGNPCAFTVDAALKSQIASEATSSASAALYSSTHVSSQVPTSTNAAVAPPITGVLGPALAAVGVVYCIVYQ